MSLLDATTALLQKELAAGATLRELAPDGGPVEYEWLKKFSSGKIDDPSVNRIQALHDSLSKRRLRC
jgi:hypothetical protein